MSTKVYELYHFSMLLPGESGDGEYVLALQVMKKSD